MTDAARRLRQRNQPGLASADKPENAESATNDSGSSQRRPAVRYYEPLPLGSDAFMAPLAPPQEPQSVDRRRLALYCILGGAFGIALGGAALVFLHNPANEPDGRVRILDMPTGALEAPKAEAKAPAAKRAPEPKPEPKLAAPAPVPAPVPEPAPAAAPAAVAAAPQAQPQAQAQPRPASESSSRRSARRAEKLSDKPTRAEVLAAMARVQPAAKACFNGKHGMATADIKVQGSTGRVSSAQVSGQNGAVGSCIARAVRKAQFPRFTDDSISIRYPMAF